MADYKQIAELLNNMTSEMLGESAVLINEDLSNVVDFGKQILGSEDSNKWLTTYVDRIGESVAYDRIYKAATNLGIYKTNLDYATMLQRMMIDELPEAEENETWEVQDGVSIDPFVVKLPKASAKYFNKRNAWEIDMTVLDRQYRSAFTSPAALVAFHSMVMNAVGNSKTLKIEALEKAILRSMIATTIKKNYSAASQYPNKSTTAAVNVLYLYNQEHAGDAGFTPLTKANCMNDKEFLRFLSMTINEYVRAVQEYSKIYNVDAADRFTPVDKLHLTVLGKAADRIQYNLEADTFHNNLVSLPGFSTIDAWQATPSRAFDKLSAIDVTNEKGTVSMNGVIAVIYDADAAGVTLNDYRVLNQRNEKGEYTNYFFKGEFSSVAFTDMNTVVFFIA